MYAYHTALHSHASKKKNQQTYTHSKQDCTRHITRAPSRDAIDRIIHINNNQKEKKKKKLNKVKQFRCTGEIIDCMHHVCLSHKLSAKNIHTHQSTTRMIWMKIERQYKKDTQNKYQ